MKINTLQKFFVLGTLLVAKPSLVVGTGGLPIEEPKLNTVIVQKWGDDTATCGSSTKPCFTINYGLFRVASTITEPPYSEDLTNNILVGPGEYNENVIFNKSGIKIISLFGSDVTIITAQDTGLDTVNINADGVYFGKRSQGFTVTGSLGGNGLSSTGSYGVVEGNQAIGNGAVGFHFSEQVETKVSYNLAKLNRNSGFYFFDFDHSIIDHNQAQNNTSGLIGPPGPGAGSGFWVDFDCNDDVFESNVATRNQRSGIFYRRFGVNRHMIRNNLASKNLLHGFVFMGDEIKITNNVSVNNVGSGFLFMGYDRIDFFTYNTAIGNTSAGVVFGADLFSGSVVSDISHNNYINNDSIDVTDHNNCGIINNLAADAIKSKDDFWGDMNVPGPGSDPADGVCGFAIEVETPTSQMNVLPE